MSIPSEYPDIESYISKVFEFLNEYQWIYDYKNTEILHNGTFDYIPFDLRHTNLDDWPDNFKVFFEQLVDLKQFTVPTSDSVPLKLSEKYPTRGLKVKKLHELLQLGPLIHKVCSSNNIHTIVDIGSGRVCFVILNLFWTPLNSRFTDHYLLVFYRGIYRNCCMKITVIE